MEERRVADGWLIPSVAKLDFTDPGGRGYKGIEAQSWEEGILPRFAFLVNKSASHALVPHVRTSGGVKNGRGNDATLSSLSALE